MLLTRTSDLSGKTHTMDLPITEAQLQDYESNGGLIQHVFPQLNDEQREFILTGCTQEEWDEAFNEPDEDE